MDIQFPQILFQAINFLVVAGGLTYLLYKPILKLFEERAQRIAEGQEAAEAAFKQREEIDQLGERTQQKLDKKTAEVMEKAAQEAVAEKEQIIKDAQATADEQLAGLKAKWEVEKAQLVKDLHSQLANAVIDTANKVVKTSLKPAQHKALIDQELSSILKQI